MISAHIVKARLLELYQARPGAAGVALVYGVPESPEDVSGDDPLFKLAVGFEDPIGEFTISELCGPDSIEYDETYTLPCVVQAIARTRDAGFYDVEEQVAAIVYQLTRVLQDPQLGLLDGSTLDSRLSRLRVTMSDTDSLAGWHKVGSTRLAAGRTMINLEVEALVKGDAQL